MSTKEEHKEHKEHIDRKYYYREYKYKKYVNSLDWGKKINMIDYDHQLTWNKNKCKLTIADSKIWNEVPYFNILLGNHVCTHMPDFYIIKNNTDTHHTLSMECGNFDQLNNSIINIEIDPNSKSTITLRIFNYKYNGKEEGYSKTFAQQYCASIIKFIDNTSSISLRYIKPDIHEGFWSLIKMRMCTISVNRSL